MADRITDPSLIKKLLLQSRPTGELNIGQKVQVIPYNFVVSGIKCEELGFTGSVTGSKGYSEIYKDEIISIRRSERHGSKNSQGGIYHILKQYVRAI